MFCIEKFSIWPLDKNGILVKYFLFFIEEKEHESMVTFADELLAEINRHDHIETSSGKKVCTGSIKTHVPQKIKPHTKIISVVTSGVLRKN